MRLTAGLSIFTLLIAVAAGDGHAQQIDTSLAPGRAGSFENGMPIDSVLRIVGRENTRLVDLALEGHFAPALEIDLPGGPSPSLVARISQWPCGGFAIYGIEVFDPRFRTAGGLGVGSTIAELRRTGAARFNREEGHSLMIGSLSMAFKIDGMSFADSVRALSVWLPSKPGVVKAKWCPRR